MAGLSEHWLTAQREMPPSFHQNCPFAYVIWPLYYVLLWPTCDNIPKDITISSATFAWLTVVIDRQTDRPRYSVCSNKPQLTTAVMRPKRCQFDGKYVVLCLHHITYNHALQLLGAHWFIMALLCDRAGHYIFALWFLSFFIFLSFPRLISATADWMFTVLRHLVWP